MDIEHECSTTFTSPRPSIWNAAADELVFPPLETDLDVDVAVIGAGITGITAAALLTQAGRRVAVLEAERVGVGTTGHSTGNLYATVDQYLHTLSTKWGREKTAQVVRSRSLAIDLVENNVRRYRLQCGFSRQPWVLYAANAENGAVIEQEYQAVLAAGLDAGITNELPLPFDIDQALVVSHQAQFHPLHYVRRLAAAIRSERCMIFEGSAVTGVNEDKGIVKTARHTVKAEHIVMATHTPKGFNPVQMELAPYREYAVAAPLAQKRLAGGIFWSAGPEKYSTRLVESRGEPYVLMIGEKHKTGHIEDSDAAYRKLEAEMQARFDTGATAFCWSAQHYRPVDGLPYIGAGIGSSRLYLASGFATDGLTYGTLAAIILSDQIAGKRHEFSDLYSPRRFTPVKSAAAFLKENLNVAAHYVKDYIKRAEAARVVEVRRGEGRIVDIGGDKLAVYRDDAWHLHVVSPVCTHLKCMVHWNQAERSWDCPCHGSRFSYDGEVLEGPALAPLPRGFGRARTTI